MLNCGNKGAILDMSFNKRRLVWFKGWNDQHQISIEGIQFLEANIDFENADNNVLVDAVLLTYAYEKTGQAEKLAKFKEYLKANVKFLEDKDDIVFCKKLLDQISDFNLDLS